MPKEKPGATHVTTKDGVLLSEHDQFDQAQARAATANAEAEKLGIKVRYEAHDNPYEFK